MRIEIDYDTSLHPPAPIVPVTVEGPAGMLVLVRMLLDTGADCTVLPESVVRRLRLPPIDRVTIAGVVGGHRRVTAHVAHLALGDTSLLVRVVAFGHEAILGRDAHEHVVVRLHGPEQRVTVSVRRGPTQD